MVNETGAQPPGATASSVRGASGAVLRHAAPISNIRHHSTSEKSTRTLLRVRVLVARSAVGFVFIRAFFPSHTRNTSVDLVSIRGGQSRLTTFTSSKFRNASARFFVEIRLARPANRDHLLLCHPRGGFNHLGARYNRTRQTEEDLLETRDWLSHSSGFPSHSARRLLPFR